MAGVWSYEGKRVLVSGGGGAGMGAAAVRDLIELGAEVHVFDVKEPSSEVASYRSVDLRDPAAIEAAVAELGGPLDALFNCAGLPGPPFSGLDTMLVNFVAARHLTGLAVAHMDRGAAVCTISSAGAFGWENTMGQVADLIATPGYAEARQWCEDNAAAVGEGYLLSKQAIIVWTLHAALDLAPRGIRVNCTSPGPTQTPMMPSFESYMGKDFMDRFPKPLGGRNSTPEEQGHLVVFLNSDAASYITGANVYADGGFSAGMLTSRLDFSVLSGETPAG
ncbi:MAG TPA: coniferyl-alcohol dehydrogenase [Acidimicrobiales bacterium]|nr:coniferyl-alcohol dehydrogenase [Acidimicrobiales bacterium]HLN43317.1 coniferyl-alcohol dehydrogenase [Acidimicrobiales bacterium]